MVKVSQKSRCPEYLPTIKLSFFPVQGIPMYFLQDHIFSIILAGSVLLILAQIFRDAQDAGIQDASQYSSYTHTLNFAETIQRDFRNIGSGVPVSDPMITAYSWSGVNKFIEFRGAVYSDSALTVHDIRYQVVFTDSMATMVNDSLQTVPVFEVQRLQQDSTGTWQFAGASAPTLLNFEIQLKDKFDMDVTAPSYDNARQIFVRMITVPPLTPDRASHQAEWQTTFRPDMLRAKG